LSSEKCYEYDSADGEDFDGLVCTINNDLRYRITIHRHDRESRSSFSSYRIQSNRCLSPSLIASFPSLTLAVPPRYTNDEHVTSTDVHTTQSCSLRPCKRSMYLRYKTIHPYLPIYQPPNSQSRSQSQSQPYPHRHPATWTCVMSCYIMSTSCSALCLLSHPIPSHYPRSFPSLLVIPYSTVLYCTVHRP